MREKGGSERDGGREGRREGLATERARLESDSRST